MFGFFCYICVVVYVVGFFLSYIVCVEVVVFYFVVGCYCYIGVKIVGVDVCQVVGVNLLFV